MPKEGFSFIGKLTTMGQDLVLRVPRPRREDARPFTGKHVRVVVEVIEE